MRRRQNPSGDESGSALAVVIILTFVIMVLVSALMQLVAQDAALAMRDVRVSRAHYSAEAGVQKGEAWIRAQSVRPTVATFPFGSDPVSFGGGLMLVAVTPDNLGAREFYTIRSLATVEGKSRAIEVDVTPTAFTDYLYYTNRDLGTFSPGYFKSGDVIDGPIYVGDEIAIWGDPTFTDEVKTTANTIYYNNGGSSTSLTATSNPPEDEPIFQRGVDFGTYLLDWLEQSDLAALEAVADITLGGSWDIVFGRDDGSGPMLGWVSMKKEDHTTWTDVEIPPEGIIIYTGGETHISGIVDGQATICTGGYIEIADDITYADSDADGPRPGCDDILGLIGNTKLHVANNAANQSDCVVHAHMMAINNNSALVEAYDVGSPRGTLTLYGGVAQDKWGPVGTGYYDAYGEFHVLTGYVRDFHYDWRLREMLPPGYELLVFQGGGLTRLAWRMIPAVDLESWDIVGLH